MKIGFELLLQVCKCKPTLQGRSKSVCKCVSLVFRFSLCGLSVPAYTCLLTNLDLSDDVRTKLAISLITESLHYATIAVARPSLPVHVHVAG